MTHETQPTRRVAVVAALVVAFVASVVVGTTGSTRPAAALATSGLGTNLAAVDYYDGGVQFANLMDQAGDWVPQSTGGAWGTGSALTLRRDGWPASFASGQYASAVLAELRYPAGTYAVEWSGKGAFDINGRNFGSASVSGGTGTVTLDGSSIVVLNLRSTDPTDPIRAVDVRVPGEARSAVFRGAYLAQLAPYKVLRFMDWQRTNSTFGDASRSFTCANRVLSDSYSQGTVMGVSVERMVALANLVGADPWFTIPHEATLDWVTCHAQIVAATLAPGLTPRYEFSNETWNPQFRAFHELQAEGVAAGLGGGDPYLALQQRHAQRHVDAMAAITNVFTTSSRPFVRVMAGQAANAWVLDQRLAMTGAAAATDELAIAPYLHVHGYNLFDPADASVVAGWTQAQLFANLATAQSAEVDVWTADHVALARGYSKRLVTYEAGQHLAGDTSNAALTSLLTSANRSAAMGTAYSTYLEHWKTATNGALLVHFTDVGPSTQFGSWGALEYPEQSTSPKYEALRTYATANPPTSTTTTSTSTTTTSTSTTSTTTTTTVAPAPAGLRFVAVDPSRLLDSRAASTLGGYSTPWGAATTRDVQISGRGAIPVDAVAIVANLTAVNPSAISALTVWPSGQARPASSDLRTSGGVTLANSVTVPLGAGGRISIANDNGTTDVLLDVAGYFTTSSTAPAGGFTALSPARIIDTRSASRVGPYSTPWGQGQTRTVTVAGAATVPKDATAVVLVVHAINPTAAGFLEAWPAGPTRPTALSSLNFPAKRSTANQVTVKLGTNGAISLFNLAGSTDVTIDVVGYYRAGSGSAYFPLAPARVLDSRAASSIGGFATPWGAGTTRTVQLGGRGGVPADALAVTGNWTTQNATAASRLLVWPQGLARPVATSSAFPASTIATASITTKLATNGATSVNNSSGSVDVIADVDGYYR